MIIFLNRLQIVHLHFRKKVRATMAQNAQFKTSNSHKNSLTSGALVAYQESFNVLEWKSESRVQKNSQQPK